MHFVNPHIWRLGAEKTLYIEKPKESEKLYSSPPAPLAPSAPPAPPAPQLIFLKCESGMVVLKIEVLK
ncbi:MAG: hypothetical protein F6K31_43905 [Symploca sp. SIO2G7]|nr:hypothetical protein [Symploca sp. SIO2G7]